MTGKIIDLFPTAIYINSLNIQFNIKQIKYLNNKYETKNPLNLNLFKNIKKELEKKSKNCLEKTLLVNPKVNIAITNSEFNFCLNGETNIKQYFNSYLTGVYCFQSSNRDEISFVTSQYSQIKVKPTFNNIYNSHSWKYPLKPGDLFLFPSSLKYDLNSRKNEKEDRILLFFNTYITNIAEKNFMKWMISLDDKGELIII
jgi:hypothetical protein